MNDVTQLPFNHFLGLERNQPGSDRLLTLPAAAHFHNHVGTVHASALYSLAEASSGQFLVENLTLASDSIVPLLRNGAIKYRKPAIGAVFSRGVHDPEAWNSFHETYARKRRAIVSFIIELHTETEGLVAKAEFDWFIAERQDRKSEPDEGTRP